MSASRENDLRKRVVMALLAAVLPACAAGEPAGDANFDEFWGRFRAAVAQNAQSEVRALTRFPFMYESRDRSAGGFADVYAALFDEKARACISNATPVLEDDSYMVFCGAIIYVFAQESGRWRFTEFAADPEAVMESGS